MGIRLYNGYVSMTPRQTFRIYFIFSALFNVFGLIGCFTTHINDAKLTMFKWLGGLVGAITNSAILVLVYVLCNIAEITVLGVILFIIYYVGLILWTVISKIKKSNL